MHVLQKRINKETFGKVVERMSSKLAGWKGRILSLAGRITLTKAVLGSVPVHSMSSCKFPESTTKSLDRISRDFVWGSTPERRKQHLLSWDKICLPKAEGGLGIRQSSLMNKALLAKVGWRMLHDVTSLWSKVVRSKYRVGDIHDGSWLVTKGTWSSTWRSVVLGLKEVIVPGHGWVIEDGRSIQFWTDKWLIGQALEAESIVEVPQAILYSKACDMWIDGIGWDMQRIGPYVTEDVRLSLAAVVIDKAEGVQDRLSWSDAPDGKFTVSSAYRNLSRDRVFKPNMGQFFRRVWRVLAPERVRVFFWLVGNHGIMTNQERFRRHIGDMEICQVCKAGVESILHVLRDCPAMTGLWRRIVPAGKQQVFFTSPLLNWIFDNLSAEAGTGLGLWPTLFAVAVWWVWKWRCGNVFGENKLWRDRVKFVKDYAKEVYQGMRLCKDRNTRVSEERLIAWLPPMVSWMKLNTDGASHGNPGLATAGGVLRNGEGHWCGGFALNIGRCTAPMAELWGVYYGLCFAWEQRITRLEVEVDSLMVVGFLKTGIEDSHPLSFLVRLCHGFLSKDWEVRVTHVYREANRLADGLANYAFSLPFGLHSFDVVPPDLLSVLVEDERGDLFPRQVRV
ncbi:unnamed protein product [Microthlaspi erraticum]|uniref:RNase H type-1 domain-containing protein n=1 Tax=Microthlaspi erraticum TaxID=1685480 RepID=A0A6D2HZ53_9BRAS|nr:unnamed protein product [Microthlaspi erraticum]